MNIYMLHHLLLDASMKFPARTAVAFGRRRLTYAALNRESDRLAKVLAESGVGGGDRVGLLFDKSIEAIIGIFAILKTGACYVPIDPLSPRVRAEHILENCKIRVVLTSSAFLEQPYLKENSNRPVVIGFWLNEKDKHVENDEEIDFVNIKIIESNRCKAESVRNNRLNINPIDVDPAYILHTSGSTGVPKGVVVAHRNALAFVNMASEFFNINHLDNFCSQAPFHFDLSVFDIFVAIKKGATITLAPAHLAMFPSQFAEFIDREGITIINSVSSVIVSLAGKGQLERFKFESLRYVLFSGDVMPVKYIEIAMRYMANAKFFNIYGQTEANSSTCYFVDRVPDEANWVIPIGKSFPNFDVFALGEGNIPISCPGEIGELYVKSSSVSMGYLGNEKATSEVFVADPRSLISNTPVYKTGDLVRLDERGDFVFVGRRDQQVKSRGHRIQLNEIEHVLKNCQNVFEAAVIPLEDEVVGNRIFSFVSATDGKKISEEELLEVCIRFLQKNAIPEKIYILDKMPRNSNGKINRPLLHSNLVNGFLSD